MLQLTSRFELVERESQHVVGEGGLAVITIAMEAMRVGPRFVSNSDQVLKRSNDTLIFLRRLYMNEKLIKEETHQQTEYYIFNSFIHTVWRKCMRRLTVIPPGNSSDNLNLQVALT